MSDMLISPAKKRHDELRSRLREILAARRPPVEAADEVRQIETELNQLREQIELEKSGSPALLRG